MVNEKVDNLLRVLSEKSGSSISFSESKTYFNTGDNIQANNSISLVFIKTKDHFMFKSAEDLIRNEKILLEKCLEIKKTYECSLEEPFKQNYESISNYI